jgi:ribosome modulation factor
MAVLSKLRAYLEGFDACMRLRDYDNEIGKASSVRGLVCPYDDEIELHKAWLLGWIDAATECGALQLGRHPSVLH